MTDSYRRELLETAADLVDGDRNVSYGDPIQDFRRTGQYWGIHIAGIFSRHLKANGYAPDEGMSVDDVAGILCNLIDPHDVAIMMMQLKHSRLAWSPEKEDHWADAAGYAACGWDCVVREND